MSDKVLDRIISLAAEGCEVRFSYFFSDSAIEIRVIKNGLRAARVLTIEEIKQSNFDIMLYSINRLVELVDA